MVLKSLILQGFKSFPDKTEIQFAAGLTAIVGPNGSGKSNISDAIRWVLGEQSSRTLRGVKMEDVIFGGTVKRGPLGFAEVSLILNNTENVFHSDFTEIMVTRRYYRSGESEYYLNKQHCRLRDIHELFMDTGLGRDGYSVIGQGRIDEILSIKSEDRREIFEEAAGITKFRYRKEEAEHKLAATEDNLVRIRDVYAELEAQKEPLERQCQRAKQYLLLRDELRVLEISLWLLQMSRIQIEVEKNTANLQTCDRQLTDVRTQRDALYTQSDALTEQLRQADRQTEELRAQLRQCEQRIADHDRKRAVLQTNIENDKNNIVRVQEESDRTKAQTASLTEQLQARQKQCDALDAAHVALLEKQSAYMTARNTLQADTEALQSQILQKQTEKQHITEEKFQFELERASAQSGLNNMETRRGTIVQDIEASESRLHAEMRQQSDLEKQLADCMETAAGCQNKVAGIALKAENRRAKVEKLTAENHALSAQHTDCKNRIRMLTEMQKEYEGFSRSVKLIMSQAERGTMHGIHGPVSSLLRVPDDYILAIETALGAAASNIVVSNPSVGRDAIQYLKQHDGGRATFLPLDTIRPNSLQAQGFTQESGFCGIADTLVQCDAPYRNIISNLLGRTLIIENMDAAMVIARKHHNRFRIVTKDGQVIQAGGAMTGGSASKSTGVLARAAKLRTLQEQKKSLEQQVSAAADALQAAKRELSALDFDLKAIESQRIRAQEERVRLTAVVEQHSAFVENLRQRSNALMLERDNLSAARAQYEAKIQTAAASILQKDSVLTECNTALHALERRLAEQEQAQTVQDRKITQLSTEIAQNRTETAAERRALADLEQLRQNMADTLSDSAETIRKFEQKIEQMQYELAHAAEQEQKDHAQAASFRQSITDASAQRMRIEGEKTAAEKAAQAQSEEILNLEREHARLENHHAQLQNEETQIVNKMWESYELTPTPAAEIARPITDITQTQQQADTLRAQMRALGNVNLDAITEYEKLFERYTFLGAQKSDLERAQKELYEVIARLTENMKEIFGAEFAKLNTLFQQTFREMFGGGHAELILEDTNDILNCGIEIRVSPPGKALKTITLLSGGEKAFVAIALYFAIIKLRPTPFCILDEIEAALDDVNVSRYAKYIRRLSNKTQFIVITHRRGTMEEADMLYGVTMQEQGVSKLLMLNMAEAEERLGLHLK